MRSIQLDWRSTAAQVPRALHGAWEWLFGAPPAGWAVSWALVFLLAADVGASTSTADWVPGADTLGSTALLGVVVGGVLALMGRLRALPALAAILLAGLVFCAERAGWTELRSSAALLVAGDVGHGAAILLFSVHLLMWTVGAWLGWCVLRWRQPLLALVPAVATFATNLLNFPAGQDAFLLYFAALTVMLLLWAGYRRSLEQARRRGLRLTPESRWDFWESGVVAGVALLVVAFFAPPLSTVDRTVDAQSGLIKAWSDVQLRMHHALPAPSTSGAVYSTGFSDQVALGHPLVRNGTVVFTYKLQGSAAATLYFRGLAVPVTDQGEWRYEAALESLDVLPPNTPPAYAETYSSLQPVTVNVQMLHPPGADRSVFFYPGQLQAINQPSLINQMSRGTQIYTVDALGSLTPSTAGKYKVTGSYSTAGEAQLRAAGTVYPAWVLPYADFNDWTGTVYRDPAVEQRIQALAQQVTAGTANPYDAAKAIETYLRSGRFTYKLNPPATPAGQDPLAFFLFQSHQGYCEYFASAMGDMLRSIGIPARLVNGFGPGDFDQKTDSYTVRASDAHTWVEVYFPQYGWIPFEPTPDGTYFPIPRGTAACQAGVVECAASTAPGTAPAARRGTLVGSSSLGFLPGGQSSGGRPFGLPFNPLPWVLGFLALVLAVFMVVSARLLTPRTAGRAWRRTQLLSRLAGVPAEPAETPLEFGRRLARALPPAREAAEALGRAFTQAAYAPPELAAAGGEDVMTAWQALRPVLLREAAARAARRR